MMRNSSAVTSLPSSRPNRPGSSAVPTENRSLPTVPGNFPYSKVHSGDIQESDSQPRPPPLCSSSTPRQILCSTLQSETMDFLSTSDSDSSLRIDPNIKVAVFSPPRLKGHQKITLDRQSSRLPTPPHTSSSAIQLLPPNAFLPKNGAGFASELRLQNQVKKQKKDSELYLKPPGDQRSRERNSNHEQIINSQIGSSFSSTKVKESEPGRSCLTLAEELSDIRKRLSAFQENKDKLR